VLVIRCSPDANLVPVLIEELLIKAQQFFDQQGGWLLYLPVLTFYEWKLRTAHKR
jgi:hypothetical protein